MPLGLAEDVDVAWVLSQEEIMALTMQKYR